MLYKEENFITTFGEEKKRKKLEIVCDLENGKILWDQEIIGEMRKIENNKKK